MRILILGLAFVFFMNYSFAQKLAEIDVPKVVRDNFVKMYPGIKKVKWEKEDGKFEAGFDLKKIETSVVFDDKGDILEVESEIKEKEVPSAIIDNVKKDFKDCKIKETSKIEASGSENFEIEIVFQGKSFELLYEKSGKLIKKIEIKKKENKD